MFYTEWARITQKVYPCIFQVTIDKIHVTKNKSDTVRIYYKVESRVKLVFQYSALGLS